MQRNHRTSFALTQCLVVYAHCTQLLESQVQGVRIPHVATVRYELFRQAFCKPVVQHRRFDNAFNISHLKNIQKRLVCLQLFFELRHSPDNFCASSKSINPV